MNGQLHGVVQSAEAAASTYQKTQEAKRVQTAQKVGQDLARVKRERRRKANSKIGFVRSVPIITNWKWKADVYEIDYLDYMDLMSDEYPSSDNKDYDLPYFKAYEPLMEFHGMPKIPVSKHDKHTFLIEMDRYVRQEYGDQATLYLTADREPFIRFELEYVSFRRIWISKFINYMRDGRRKYYVSPVFTDFTFAFIQWMTSKIGYWKYEDCPYMEMSLEDLAMYEGEIRVAMRETKKICDSKVYKNLLNRCGKWTEAATVLDLGERAYQDIKYKFPKHAEYLDELMEYIEKISKVDMSLNNLLLSYDEDTMISCMDMFHIDAPPTKHLDEETNPYLSEHYGNSGQQYFYYHARLDEPEDCFTVAKRAQLFFFALENIQPLANELFSYADDEKW